ncbi:MAG: VanZ family protein [Eubacterium sp.]
MWVLVVLCMGVIFYFSSRPANISAMQSDAILRWFIKHFGDGAITDFAVRKSAHFLEFTGLCFLFNWAWRYTKDRAMPMVSVICTSLYAVSDEVHQLFVEGRSCQVSDWALDTLGAVTGTLGFIVIYVIIRNIEKRKNRN